MKECVTEIICKGKGNNGIEQNGVIMKQLRYITATLSWG